MKTVITRNKGWFRRALCVLVSLLIVAGCGIKWWYDQVDYLLRMQVDQYFDITSSQEDFITRQLEKHLRWHRYEGLPVHIRFLSEVQTRLADGVVRDDIIWFFVQYRKQVQIIVEQLSDDSVEFLTQLRKEQIDYFTEQLAEENEELEERLEMTAEERLEKRADKTIDFLEEWLGSLSDDQEAEIRQMSRATPDRFKPWYQKRILRQRSFITAIRENRNRQAIRESLLQMLLPPARDKANHSDEPGIRMIIAIDRMATPAQREHLLQKLKKWEDALLEISNKFSE